jgi:hypothetical protein
MSCLPPRLALLAAFAAALALQLGSSAGAATPTLYANYAANCTFAFVGDGGAPVTSIAPGTYQLVVATPFAFSNGLAACETIQFHLTGPGINLDTDLGSGDAEVEQHTVTLQAGATYTVQDDARPAQTRRTFTVAVSGSSAAPSGSTSTSSSSGSSSGTKGGTPSKDPVGSAIVFRGRLAALVSKAGKLTLTKSAKAVSTLKSGRYTVEVLDGSSRAGFVLQPLKGPATTVTTVRFTGARSMSLRLSPGQWYFSTPGGTRHPFVVTG